MQAKNSLNYVFALFILINDTSFKSHTSPAKENLKVVVNNIRSSKGQIGFYLFNSKIGFPTHPENAILIAFVKANRISTAYTFPNIKMGTYAVCAFHDENIDKKIGKNWIGIPNEGIGISNNAKGNLGPPKFDDAKFIFNKPEQTITISLKYL
jgi:uncharacterized protein (DUF2141 family)